MNIAHVIVYTWDWEVIGQASFDLDPLYRNGEIDRGEMDDAVKKAAAPLIEGISCESVHVFAYSGDQVNPEDLTEAVRQEYESNGPNVESWPHGRRIKNTEPVKKLSIYR
jgi:hypothetical protein